jgi:hypothetical protein
MKPRFGCGSQKIGMRDGGIRLATGAAKKADWNRPSFFEIVLNPFIFGA